MGFYQKDKAERQKIVARMNQHLLHGITKAKQEYILAYFSDNDTYIRKSAYLATGRIYKENKQLKEKILELLEALSGSDNEKIRQTAINAAGEIGMIDFKAVGHLMEQGLFDDHHSVRNAVIGSIKKMGAKNPKPVLAFAKKFLHHENKEIRREICHGIELRGRTHPQDILPLLKELQHDKTARVRNTLVHVIGQISYKKGCLETVISHLKNWDNAELVEKAIEEIIDVHHRYKNFSALTQAQARKLIEVQCIK